MNNVNPSWALNELLGLDLTETAGLQVTGLQLDSRKVTPGDLFFALPGHESDGRAYIEQALKAGAVAVVYENSDGYQYESEGAAASFGVGNLADQIGDLASLFYGHPSEQMQVFGFTGTNGKTTCAYLLTQALEELGMPTALIGTIGVGRINQLNSSGLTTPDVISVHRLFAEWLADGIKHVCMEVSSHALDQGRVNGVHFFCTLFTNLSHDHLDYHGDLAAYRKAKEKLFTEFQAELVVTNCDDEVGSALVDIAASDFITSYGQAGDLQIDAIESNEEGLRLSLATESEDFTVQSKLVGQVNAPNIALVATTLLALGIEQPQVIEIIGQLDAAPGRMQLISQAGLPQAVIDYAHTPDALAKALESLKLHCQGELWCVFGCGGDRDKDKRPLMTKAALELAAKVVVTDDNPRTESPEAIVADMLQGLTGEQSSSVHVIHDRRSAIKYAIEQANQDDWVLIAGKGHEQGQIFANKVMPFNDAEVAQSLMGVAI